MENAARINPAAYAAVLEAVRSAWALVDNTGYDEFLPLAINRDDWNDLAASMAALNALIPAGELPAEPPHAVVCCWPAASGSRPELSEVTELQIRYLCSALGGSIDEKAALALRVRELEADCGAAIGAIRNTIVALDAQGCCQMMADALRILIDRVDAGGSIRGEWPPSGSTDTTHQPPKPQST
ncbi:hypothetical protein ABID82_007012 [Methylobacterium sp. PvP062]|uniref:Uncharacterized protein n=1 Tax=Methylobacterium radiotolerans TaxID=31998 RepID=A0ABV2NPB0_9HYPH|nr:MULTISPECIES: hypothetical protein [unclassified Methylobacterium]MBP2494916.1 hypothetical protein [Methylobacterium sp. PvP105]MBP2505213.1 hypothetical protein [Methylobacterium sp. PvP109]MCX7330041.1 hypothetical protein [Hyphomicrobiales bacterium]